MTSIKANHCITHCTWAINPWHSVFRGLFLRHIRLIRRCSEMFLHLNFPLSKHLPLKTGMRMANYSYRFSLIMFA
ncbi:MAG: hypothetical protein IJ748_04795, partial [Bacteroidales bacterium]|nr:hypothetical protein [Bacteroidales bacterium]